MRKIFYSIPLKTRDPCSTGAKLADVYPPALHRGGRLATFDRTIPWKAGAGAKADDIEVIGA
jgi:hypothetical protein